jgi:F-type H+-transporting ATPase subunit alpha
LKQSLFSPLRVEQQIAIIYTGTNNLLKDVPVAKVKEFEKEFLNLLEIQHKTNVLEPLSKGIINDEVEKILTHVALEISTKYKK